MVFCFEVLGAKMAVAEDAFARDAHRGLFTVFKVAEPYVCLCFKEEE